MTSVLDRLASIPEYWDGGDAAKINPATGVCGYVRISQDDAGDEFGVERQKAAIIELAIKLGIDPKTIVWYIDNNTSATSDKLRPQYEAMLRDIRNGLIGRVLVWHSDRLLRSSWRDLGVLVEIAEKVGGFIVDQVAGFPMNLNTKIGILMLQCATAFAEYEVKHKAERQALKYRQQVNAGEFQRVRCIGYAKDGTVIEDEAKHVREIFRRFNDGHPLRAIVRYLDENNVKNTRGNSFSPSLVRWVLTNPAYIGVRARSGDTNSARNREILMRGAWTPIIDPAQFELAQVKMEDSAKRYHQGNALKWLGIGLYVCGECGGEMTTYYMRVSDGKGGVMSRRSYRCADCKLTRGFAEEIDDFVSAHVVQFLNTTNLPALLAASGDEHDSKLAELSAALVDCDRKADMITAHMIDALGNDVLYAALVKASAEIVERRALIRSQIDETDERSALALLVDESDPGAYWDALESVSARQNIVRAAGGRIELARAVRGPGGLARIPATVNVIFRRVAEPNG